MSPALISDCCAARWDVLTICISGSPNISCTSASSRLIIAVRYTVNMKSSRPDDTPPRRAEDSTGGPR